VIHCPSARLLDPELGHQTLTRTLQKLHQSSAAATHPETQLSHRRHCRIDARPEPLKSSNMMSKASAGTKQRSWTVHRGAEREIETTCHEENRHLDEYQRGVRNKRREGICELYRNNCEMNLAIFELFWGQMHLVFNLCGISLLRHLILLWIFLGSAFIDGSENCQSHL
jgi:hypothetical protein